jgi:hypothetical protein
MGKMLDYPKWDSRTNAITGDQSNSLGPKKESKGGIRFFSLALVLDYYRHFESQVLFATNFGLNRKVDPTISI